MAKAANNANVEREMEGPDYPGAIELIRGPISRNKSEASSLGQDNSTIYKRIDKQHGVHGGAAKDFAKIDGMQADKRVDYLRSLLGLLKHAKYDKFNDLVDQMTGAPTAKAPAKGKKTKVDAPISADDANAFVAKAGQKPSGTPAGTTPPADDSDLADEPKFVVFDPVAGTYLAKIDEDRSTEWDERSEALLLSEEEATKISGENADTEVHPASDSEPAPPSPITAALEKSRAHLQAVPDVTD